MNRELLVKLIKKNIDELIMLTDGFLEMTTYPDAIISLAKNKTDDIWGYINELGALNIDSPVETHGRVSTTPDIVGANKHSPDIDIENNDSPVIDIENDDSPVIDDVDDVAENEDVLEVAEDIEDIEDIEVNEVREVKEVKEVKEVTGYQATSNQQPATSNQQPATSNQQPVTSNQQPATSNQQPVTSNQQTTDSTIPKPQQTLAEKLSSAGITRNEALAKGSNGDVNTSIAHAKVEDIRQAISLGDRFRFQRELFRNNGEEMNKILAYINKLATYREVIDFLKAKYAWEDDNPTVEDFYQIIQRKF